MKKFRFLIEGNVNSESYENAITKLSNMLKKEGIFSFAIMKLEEKKVI